MGRHADKIKAITKGQLTVSATVLCAILGISREMLFKHSKAGMPKQEKNKYNLSETIQWFLKQHEEKVRSQYTGSKQRKEAAEASLKELQLSERRKELIEIEGGAKMNATAIGATRKKLLSLPRKISPMMTNLETATEAEAILTREIHEALDELAGIKFARSIEAQIFPRSDSEAMGSV